MNFSEAARKCKPILEEFPESRDSDRKLIAAIWKREIDKLPIEKKQRRSVLDLLSDGLLENPETITRARRKLQEKVEALRGKSWASRHAMEAECCEQLKLL
jgi:hypothetical protein